MQCHNTKDAYGKMSIALHWLIALLVLGMLAVGYVMEFALPEGSDDIEDVMKFYHVSTGFLVLGLMTFRLIWVHVSGLPDPAPDLEGWEAKVSKAVHWGLYALLIAMPLTGYVMSASGGKEGEPERILPFFTPGVVPNIVGRDHDLHEFMEDVHLYLSFVVLAVVAAHIGAALKHHFVLHDGVLARMIPHLAKKD
ncbi:MAG: cytochrome b [Alphaproteobacteria bacterium]|nr:cytochrome b [Alphaproteobacteria bacterium]